MKICFYTEGHIGDFLLTLPFVDLLIKKYPNNEYYQCVNGNGVRFHDSLIGCIDGLNPSEDLCGDINIPTWMCNSEYAGWEVPSDYSLEDQFSVARFFWTRIYDKHGFDVEIPDNLGINFNSAISDKEKSLIDLFGKTKNKKVIIFNQRVRSNQTDNYEYKSYLVRVSNLFPDYDFLYTNEEEIDEKIILNNNLFYTPNIFGSHECDILHNFYLSLYCDIIIGRVGGPFMFSSMHDKNVSDGKKIIISQHEENNHKSDLSIFYNRKIYKAKNIHTKSSKETFDELEKTLCQ